MVRLVLVVAVVLVSAALAHAQAPAARLSLDDAVALALRENPTLRAKQAEYRATQATEITAGLRPNPTASALAEQIGSRNDPQYTFSLGQPIELGGKRGRRLDSARAASTRRRRLPPSSMGWPIEKVCWTWAALPPPNCSPR